MSLDSVATNEQEKNRKQEIKEKELEKAKLEFFELVDKTEYKEAFDYFNSLDADKRMYITSDKMGLIRLKEIKFKGW